MTPADPADPAARDRPLATGDAMYRAICADPDCGTARLVYADWLDENGDADRAEAIRVGVELERLLDTQSEREAPCPENARIYHLKRRERELRDRHVAEWSKAPCPGCGGVAALQPKGQTQYDVRRWTGADCNLCVGTGDLLRQRVAGSINEPTWVSEPRPLTFGRGFPGTVTVPTLEELHVGDRPSLWLSAVVRAVPLRAVVPADRETIGVLGRSEELAGTPSHDWIREDAALTPAVAPHVLPPVLFDLMAAASPRRVYRPRSGRLYFESPSRAAAVDALGRALAAWGRSE